MNESPSPSAFPFAQRLARWQVLLLLVGFPLVYLANNFTPWSMGLFLEGRREWWLPFFATIFFLHWTHTILTVWILHKAGGSLAELGLPLSLRRVAIALAVFGGVGISAALIPIGGGHAVALGDGMAVHLVHQCAAAHVGTQGNEDGRVGRGRRDDLQPLCK